MGAVAAQALLGKDFRVTRDRGRRLESDLAPIVVATVHPSSVLRSRDRERDYEGLVEDLRTVASALRAT
jgi:DNA polymerase